VGKVWGLWRGKDPQACETPGGQSIAMSRIAIDFGDHCPMSSYLNTINHKNGWFYCDYFK
jgi:hypothetical protein